MVRLRHYPGVDSRDGHDGRDSERWTGQFGGLVVERDRAGGETEVYVSDVAGDRDGR